MKARSLILYSAIGISAIVLTAKPAVADDYVFGFSGGSPGILTVTTATGMLTIDSSSTGWYDQTGFHDSANTNYIAGTAGTTTYNDYFTFNLSDLRGTVLSATFSALNPSDGDLNDPFYTMYDVSTPAATLDASNSGATGIFADLGSGSIYGTHQVTAADDGVNITITLDAAAVAAINGAEGSSFSIGGSTATLTPEPSSFALMGTGLLGALRLVRRRGA